MRQTFKQALFKLLLAIFVISATIGLGVPASSKPVTEETTADLVVYGKIFTAEENQLVEAMAVKDGRYIYVGDKKVVAQLLKVTGPSSRPNMPPSPVTPLRSPVMLTFVTTFSMSVVPLAHPANAPKWIAVTMASPSTRRLRMVAPFK